MKKSIFLIFITFLVFMFPLMAKSKKSKNVEKSQESESIEIVSENTNLKENESKSENILVEEIKSEKTDETKSEKKKKEKKSKNDEVKEEEIQNLDMRFYKNWAKIKDKKINKNFGIINIRALPKTGSFNIGILNNDEKIIPVLSNKNEYTSSYFSLKSGKKIYKLLAGADVDSKVRETENLVQIIYSVKNVADVLLEFIPLESQIGSGYDILNICVTITNLEKKSANFTLKNVMDTVLGEADLYHFYTYENLPIKTETVYRTMQTEKFINSKNSAAWCQFLFYGYDISPIDVVSLLNYSNADSSVWFPEISTSRTFDSVTAYNNSAIQIIWPTQKILRDESFSFNYYLAFSNDGLSPKGLEFIEQKTNPNIIKEKLKNDENLIIENKIQTELEKEKSEIERGKVAPPTIPKELLTPDYIKNLLDRIDTLESEDQSLNKDELNMLNEELDFILSVLRN